MKKFDVLPPLDACRLATSDDINLGVVHFKAVEWGFNMICRKIGVTIFKN
jgi:hypothetical protein